MAGIATFISFSMMQSINTGGSGNQGQMMQAVMKYFFPLSILWLARSYPAGLAIYWFSSQFIQIFINIRMNKLRARIKEEPETKNKKKSKR